MNVVCALVVGCLATSAAIADELRVESSASPMGCLVRPSRTDLKYPNPPASSAKTGIVRVRMTFGARDASPQSEIFFNSAGAEFAAAVLDFVAGYRLPCLAESTTASATQEFTFHPNEILAVREGYDRLEKMAACVTGREDLPNYPLASKFGTNPEGAVFAKLTFARANEPPKVDIVFDGGDKRLLSTALTYLSGYRYVCSAGQELPVVISQSVYFSLEGSARPRLKDVDLGTFLRAIDQAQAPRARFDFTSMTCPFSIGLVLRQPHLENVVRESEPVDPNRREFVEWLRTVKLELPESVSQRFMGDTMQIAVPCVVLDWR